MIEPAHAPASCAGYHCPFHNPSNHLMLDWPMILRMGGLIERQCPHGIGHPDPDSLAWLDRRGHYGYGLHGCDGCCVAEVRPA